MAHVIIVGGGVTGLSAGIHLLESGHGEHRVTVCESGAVPGGNLTGWDRAGYHIDNCVHWLTGTASTIMVGCVEGIMGMRPDFHGLRIAPSIPKDWDEYSVEKDFRGKHLSIVVKNPNHVESGCASLTVNGEKLDGDYIPFDKMTDNTTVELVLG